MTQAQPAERARLAVVVLISGNGSNLQSIIDGVTNGLSINIRAVISNRADAYGLQRAKRAGIATEVLEHNNFTSRETFDLALQERIDSYRPDLVVLAGYMRILTHHFVKHYVGRLLNIHPSLLPAFPGLNTHQQAIAAKVKEHGASVHFVTEELDGGPVIIQARVPVNRDDTEDSLSQRVLEQEHHIYPLAIQWFSENRLKMVDGAVKLDGRLLQEPYLFQQ